MQMITNHRSFFNISLFFSCRNAYFWPWIMTDHDILGFNLRSWETYENQGYLTLVANTVDPISPLKKETIKKSYNIWNTSFNLILHHKYHKYMLCTYLWIEIITYHVSQNWGITLHHLLQDRPHQRQHHHLATLNNSWEITRKLHAKEPSRNEFLWGIFAMAGLVEELQTEAISNDICSAMSANLQITRHHEG